MKYFRHTSALGIILALMACSGSPDNQRTDQPASLIRHASNLQMITENEGIRVSIIQPYKGADASQHYLLTSSEEPAGEEIATIRTPVRSIVATATSQAGFLDPLDSGQSMVGFCTTNFISSKSIRSRVESGQIAELGPDSNIDRELLLTLQPGILIAYSVTGEVSQWQQVEQMGIPVIFDASFLETSPLAQAEWIKFFGALIGKYELADSLFSIIEKRYLTLQELTRSVEGRPTVIGGSMYSGTWFMPGGKSWVANYIEHAGGRYLWRELDQTGSVALTFESVYQKSLEADLWIGATAYNSLDHLIREDDRYGKLKAVRDRAIYSPTRRTNGMGGNDYYESGIVRPDVVLRDFILMIHPELLKEELHYYEQLPAN